MEKRRRQRVPFLLSIKLTLGDREYRYTHTQDISMGGVFVETDTPFPKDATGKLEMLLEFGEHRIPIPGRFQVVRVVDEGETRGMGLRFLELDSDGSLQLYRVIKYHRDLPEEIHHGH
jgi:hypothetical protein